MQRLSGIKECIAESNQIKVQFVSSSQSESTLYLTMTMCQDNRGHVQLSHAEVIFFYTTLLIMQTTILCTLFTRKTFQAITLEVW